MGNNRSRIHSSSTELEISLKNLSKEVKQKSPDVTLVVNNYEKIRKQVVKYLETQQNVDASLISKRGLRDIRCVL